MPSQGFETIAAPDAASSNGRLVDEANTLACERRVMFRFTRADEIVRENTLNGTSPSSRALPVSPRKSAPPSPKWRRGSEEER